jgi:signal transduction histidine kinase
LLQLFAVSSRDSPAQAAEPRHLYEIARLRLARMRVQGGASLTEALAQALALAADTLDVARVGVWLFVDDGRALRCFLLYERATRARSEGAVLHAADFPNYVRALRERRHIPASVARADPLTAELAEAYLEPLGIMSMLDAPLYRDGEVVGVVCPAHTGPLTREWTAAERDFASTVADAIALQFEGAARQDAEASLQSVQSHLFQHQRLEALGRLAAGLAHDFHDVLATVLQPAQAIVDARDAAPGVSAAAQAILAAADRGSVLARELMSIGPDERRATRVIDPGVVVERLREVLQAALGPSCTVELRREPGAGGRVLMDASQLERVVLNLAINARDSMPGGGPVRIEVSETEVPGRGGSGTYVVVEVADVGLGMEPRTLARIFEPFFTTKTAPPSRGLGLAIVSQIVDHCGGFIHVDSRPGGGTTVRVYLPRVASER